MFLAFASRSLCRSPSPVLACSFSFPNREYYCLEGSINSKNFHGHDHTTLLLAAAAAAALCVQNHALYVYTVEYTLPCAYVCVCACCSVHTLFSWHYCVLSLNWWCMRSLGNVCIIYTFRNRIYEISTHI